MHLSIFRFLSKHKFKIQNVISVVVHFFFFKLIEIDMKVYVEHKLKIPASVKEEKKKLTIRTLILIFNLLD